MLLSVKPAEKRIKRKPSIRNFTTSDLLSFCPDPESGLAEKNHKNSFNGADLKIYFHNFHCINKLSMKKLLLFGGALALTLNAYSQTIIFQDNFENGSSSWQLNGGTGGNNWIVNNVYTGFSGFIPDTPAQPSSFTGGTNSTYLHITNAQFCGLGYCNASFETGSASVQSATLASAVSTSGMTGVSLSFWYLCEGAAGTSFGTVEYSTDGTTWTQIGNQLSGVSTWTQLTLTDAALDNKATLKFRFKWQNGAAGEDPAFSVDEIKLTGTSGTSPNAIATSAVTPMTACFNAAQAVSVPFNATGTYTSGNIFTAQLSDASGSFASPTAIGTLASTTSGTINATIPAGMAAGAGYRIRVISSAPATTGADNGNNIMVYALPTVDITSVPASGTINAGQSITLTATGGTTYAWSPSTNLSAATGATVDANPSATTTYTVTATDAHGCTGTDNITVTVNSTAGIGEVLMDQDLALYPNPATEYFEVFHNYNSPIIRLVIRDNNGRRIRTYDKPKPEKFFIADLGSGVYSVAITILEETYYEKLVIP